MSRNQPQGGFTLPEVMIAMTLMVSVMGGLLGVMIHGAQINRSQQMAAEVQANARNSLNLVVRQLRTAGFDPRGVGIPTVVLDPDLTDDVSQIEIFADLNEDGTTSGPLQLDEQVIVRHVGNRLESRETDNPGEAFKAIAVDITNDEDGDGVPEPMFIPNSIPPTQIMVRITAQSPVVDPFTGSYARHTVHSLVVLRNAL